MEAAVFGPANKVKSSALREPVADHRGHSMSRGSCSLTSRRSTTPRTCSTTTKHPASRSALTRIGATGVP